MRIGYARVSTGEQSTALQLDALREAGCTHIFEDKITGISRKRPGLEQALEAVGQGDELVVICPLLSGPISILELATKEEWNGKEAQAGGDHRQAA